jgi:hypothetical protein
MSDEKKRGEELRAKLARSPRVPVSFSVDLEGQTPEGESFRARADAITVSRGGGTLKTDAPVVAGTVVKITPPFGRSIQGEVNGVWVDATDGKQRIGIKLLEAHGWFAD